MITGGPHGEIVLPNPSNNLPYPVNCSLDNYLYRILRQASFHRQNSFSSHILIRNVVVLPYPIGPLDLGSSRFSSAYSAAPGPEEVEVNNHSYGEEAETSHALFMSRHFVFPPNEHENLPLEPDDTEIHNEEGTKMWNSVFDEKGSSLSIRGSEFEEGTTLQGLNLGDKGQSIYGAAKYSSFQNEAALGGSTPYVEDMGIPGLIEPSEQGLDPVDISQLPKPSKDNKYDGSGLPCGAWWKRRAASLYSHAKDANGFWSIL
ncbi:hypothetical protein FNV43_RR16920 [Rhamnella rubrinervis]|uniref:Uncharacterized protein n=1 Tax=Rhamnella rubrinervis TaxID=2594499 RepID=A0A8K0ME19_9ROSA|nr:hypothetical protein FNV43_RR16920 [Rhamnella rubrinervis]